MGLSTYGKGQYRFWYRRLEAWDLGRHKGGFNYLGSWGMRGRTQMTQVSSGSLWIFEGWAQSWPHLLVWREKMGKLSIAGN